MKAEYYIELIIKMLQEHPEAARKVYHFLKGFLEVVVNG